MVRKHFFSLVCWAFFSVGYSVAAEQVPTPTDPNARFYIQLSDGGLSNFFRYHPMRMPLISHHRAGPAPGYPENAIETMDNALRYGFGLIEVDVAQLMDGRLILMHDDTVDRTTTGTGSISRMTQKDIAALYLVDNEGIETDYRVPHLESVLRWAKQKAILTLDIKPGTDFTRVAKAVRTAEAEDYTVAITYSVEQAQKFHKIAPEMMLTITMYDTADIATVERSGINPAKIIAWTGTDQKSTTFYKEIHKRGWRVISGTFGLDKELARTGQNEQYLSLYANGIDIIATDRFWAIQQQIFNPNHFYFVRQNAPAARSQQ
ncbi:glycerophosphodiester phosphodiesterase family protein [Kordiimonas sp.]|uniref:glycerophosphodiester phosphodiesterase family protein n=1 Tax=Kordiimonas sp. TaxID=1970157 RepID=UPI003A940D7F